MQGHTVGGNPNQLCQQVRLITDRSTGVDDRAAGFQCSVDIVLLNSVDRLELEEPDDLPQLLGMVRGLLQEKVAGRDVVAAAFGIRASSIASDRAGFNSARSTCNCRPSSSASHKGSSCESRSESS